MSSALLSKMDGLVRSSRSRLALEISVQAICAKLGAGSGLPDEFDEEGGAELFAASMAKFSNALIEAHLGPLPPIHEESEAPGEGEAAAG